MSSRRGAAKGAGSRRFSRHHEEAGLNATHRLMQWSKAQELVQVGKADGHALMSATPDRKLKYDFSHPTLDVEFTLFVNAGDEERIT
ncbi:MAG: transporter substrate-binding domain-containing protein [Candidatus Sedimenticola sp. (ex Thyasira tokunagai)]